MKTYFIHNPRYKNHPDEITVLTFKELVKKCKKDRFDLELEEQASIVPSELFGVAEEVPTRYLDGVWDKKTKEIIAVETDASRYGNAERLFYEHMGGYVRNQIDRMASLRSRDKGVDGRVSVEQNIKDIKN